MECGGKTYQLARGEFHRHTEYTAHRDGDGSLEDMWRYAQDAADMDWLGNGDHDNGFGHQYPWWITQKTMDIYHNPPWFIAPYTYERSVEWPNGHRNVIFTRRGIRTLPRGDMQRRRKDRHARHQDALRLPEALRRHLRQPYQRHEHGHRLARQRSAWSSPSWRSIKATATTTSAKGRRAASRRDNAAGRPGNEAIHPKGFIWNALAKGYRLGFESSSDHISTHASYAVALVEKPGREAIVEAFRARRCFAATDNIGLVVKCAGHLMGEEFPLAGPADPGNPRAGNRPDRQARHRPQQSLRLQHRAEPRDPRLEMDRRRPAGRAGQLLLRPHSAGRRQPGVELADVDPSAGEVIQSVNAKG